MNNSELRDVAAPFSIPYNFSMFVILAALIVFIVILYILYKKYYKQKPLIEKEE